MLAGRGMATGDLPGDTSASAPWLRVFEEFLGGGGGGAGAWPCILIILIQLWLKLVVCVLM